MPRKLRRVGSVVAVAGMVALVAAACAQEGDADPAAQESSVSTLAEPGRGENEASERDAEVSSSAVSRRAEIDEAQDVFDAAVDADYVLTFDLISSATAEAGPIRVVVVGGQATEVDYPDLITAQILPPIPFLTVHDFFSRARSVLADGGTVEVAFDESYGFPTTMTLDPIPGAIDDEMSIRVHGIEPSDSSEGLDG